MIITANKTNGNYWFRADPEGLCQTVNNGLGRAIFNYQGTTVADPTSTPNANPPTGLCTNKADVVPKTARNVPSADFASQARSLPVAIGPVASNGENVVLWTINGTSMIVDPGKPTLKYVAENNNSYPASYNVVSVSPGATVSLVSSETASTFPNNAFSGHTGSSSKPSAPRPSLTPSISMATTPSFSAPAPANSQLRRISRS